MTERKEYVYRKKTDGGEPLKANVWYNPGPSDVAKPIALYFHGGNFVLGNKDMLSPDYVDELLGLGFGAVVSPNYRLGPTVSLLNGPVGDARDSYLWSQTELPTRLAEDSNVKLDGKRIVAIGHSAGGTLALLLASLPQKPLAILDLFGMKYLEDEFYHSAIPALSKVPDFDQAVLDKIQGDIPAPRAAPPPGGPNGPDFGNYRVAWLFNGCKTGTWMRALVPDENYDNVEPSKLFSPSFPPTYFIHGSKDFLVDLKFSERAHAELKALGAETQLVVVEASHGFDAGAKPGDDYYKVVADGFKFLASHAT